MPSPVNACAEPRFLPTSEGLPIGLGCAPLGNLFHAISDAQAQSLIELALADGCRTFDTAPHYGNGRSEHRLGRALGPLHPDHRWVSSKVGRLLEPDSNAPRDQNAYVNVLPFRQRWDYSAAGVRRSVEDSLQRMGLARLNVVYVHDCAADCHGQRYPQVLEQVVSQALPELRRLQAEGLIDHIGLGVNDVQVCLDVLAQADLDVLMLAGRYSLLDHSALDALLPLCTQRGVRVALGGVFNSGLLATGARTATPMFNYAPASAHWIERTQRIEAVCEAHGVSLRAAALQFPLAHPAVEIVMLGASDTAHWSDAVHNLQAPIPAAFWSALRAQGLIPDAAPTPRSA
jgi:D-threo-aldose 1-dehydrogenase